MAEPGKRQDAYDLLAPVHSWFTEAFDTADLQEAKVLLQELAESVLKGEDTMATQTPTIDSQVHAYERNRPERPWIGYLQGPDEVTGDDMVAAMDAVGVDGALLVSPFSMYR